MELKQEDRKTKMLRKWNRHVSYCRLSWNGLKDPGVPCAACSLISWVDLCKQRVVGSRTIQTFPEKSWLSQWVNSLAHTETQATRNTWKASYLVSLLRSQSLVPQGLLIPAAQFIYSVYMGVSVGGFVWGSPNKTLKCNSFDDAAAKGQPSETLFLLGYARGHAVFHPWLNVLQKQLKRKCHGQHPTKYSLGLQSRPPSHIHTQHSLLLYITPMHTG